MRGGLSSVAPRGLRTSGWLLGWLGYLLAGVTRLLAWLGFIGFSEFLCHYWFTLGSLAWLVLL